MGLRTAQIFPFALSLSALCCTNPTTLRTAHPLAHGQEEHGLSAAGYYLEQTDLVDEPVLVLPAYSYRKGLGDGNEMGVRMTTPVNLQLDGGTSWVWGRAAFATGLGMETDVISLLFLAIQDDHEDQATSDDEDEDDDEFPLTLGLFVPLVASYDIVPEYFSAHVTGRVHGMRIFDQWGAYASAAGGIRVGKDFGVHVEAAPAVTTTGEFVWFTGAKLFFRPQFFSPENGDSGPE